MEIIPIAFHAGVRLACQISNSQIASEVAGMRTTAAIMEIENIDSAHSEDPLDSMALIRTGSNTKDIVGQVKDVSQAAIFADVGS